MLLNINLSERFGVCGTVLFRGFLGHGLYLSGRVYVKNGECCFSKKS